jgi:4-amino-4-deoxy-L-arabinose transferase-like glycosyltransferase
MGALATMVLGGADRFVALVQACAFLALAVGVIGVARGLGLSRREALLGALLVATLPVIALQASTAQNDLVVASFLVAGVAFLLDSGRGTPWLAGAATALAVGTKVTAVFGVPILVVVAFLAASTHRGQRLTGVLVGAAVGAYWYVVNWREAGSWDAGFPYEPVEPGVAAAVARGLRSGIQLIELPGAAGRDRWLYLVAAVVLFAGLAIAYRRRSLTAALGSAAGAALIAALPVLTPDVRRYVDEAYLELWRAVGRDDLAVTVGRDITRSASNVTWYGPLGALLVVVGIVVAVVAARRGIVPWVAPLLTLAPVYWIAAMSAVLFYQDAAGRFLMAPMALAGATWGLVGRRRAVAWGLAGIAVTALALAVLNDSKRPSGLPLLERPAPESYWTTPRWRAVGSEVHVPDLIRFVDERVPDDARVALAITASDPGYVLLGRRLRGFDLIPPGVRDVPGATWAFVSPLARRRFSGQLCPAWERQAESPGGWDVYRRMRTRC